MTKKKEPRNDVPNEEPVNTPPKSAKRDTLPDDQLDKIAGGFNPQPDPPGIQARLINQISKFFRP